MMDWMHLALLPLVITYSLLTERETTNMAHKGRRCCHRSDGRLLLWVLLVVCIPQFVPFFDTGHVKHLAIASASTSVDDIEQQCEVTESGDTVCRAIAFEEEDEEEEDDDDDEDELDGELDDNVPVPVPSPCVDSHELCSFWASVDECAKNPNYMTKNCMKSCNTCPRVQDSSPFSVSEAQKQEAVSLLQRLAQYGEPQKVDSGLGEMYAKTLLNVRQTLAYMTNFVFPSSSQRLERRGPTHRMNERTTKECLNRDELCSYWAAQGECQANPSFMVTMCAPACRSCHKIDFDTRCPPRDRTSRPGLSPGDLNAMFENIVANAPGNRTQQDQMAATEKKLQPDGTPIYTVTVHSRPAHSAYPPDQDGKRAVDKERDLKEDPWVITFDNFLTDDECDVLIELGYKNKYERSQDVGPQRFDGSFDGYKSKDRTSENSWCSSHNKCRDDPVVQRVFKRLEHVTNIPVEHSEDLQLLKYEVGQFYRIHHDYIEHQRDRQCGPRILTFFLYLSDVDEGGGTGFQQLNNLVISPKKGRALLWPSVLDHDPNEKDGRTMHEALPVEKGSKFAANAWIHLYNYVDPQAIGCS